jgi:cupin 2 domain-containing protein
MMKPKADNLFDSTAADLSEEVFTELIHSNHVKIERIISRGHKSPESGWYDQDEHEWVVLLKGEAEITFEEGEVVHFVPGSYLNLPAHTRHRVSWTRPDTETVWLAIHYH